jgi:arylsulfatase A-like enzyme
LGWFVLWLTFMRLYFIGLYPGDFLKESPGEVALAFLVGFRFDSAVACIMSAPFVVAYHVPGVGHSPGARRVLTGGMLVWHLALLVYQFIDIQYYAFSARHLTFELANTWREASVFVKIGLMDYLGQTILLFASLGLYAAGYMYLVRRVSRLDVAQVNVPGALMVRKWLASIFMTAMALVVISRGGIQAKPLDIDDAFVFNDPVLSVLALNGIYTTFAYQMDVLTGDSLADMLEGLGMPEPGEEERLASLIVGRPGEHAKSGYPLFRRMEPRPDGPGRMNVVVFVMESWSAKFMGAFGGAPSATPFFDSLAPKGLLLGNCLANGQRSIEGLPAVLGSLPSWKGLVFGEGGTYYQTSLLTPPQAFAQEGYRTLFVHGASPDSVRIDGVVKRLGFGEHRSMRDFPDFERHHDSVWGVYDEHVFLTANEWFAGMDEPFFAAVYSLTSHSPYPISTDEFRVFGKDVPHAKFLNSMRYSDHALQQFFARAEGSPYFERTLFVITSDHTEGRATSGNMYESYHIPCFLYAPGGQVSSGRTDVLAGQVDLLPTVIDVLGLGMAYSGWGGSVLEPRARAQMLPHGNRYVFVDDEYLLYSGLERPLKLFSYREDPSLDLLESGVSEHRALAEERLEVLRSYLRVSSALITQYRVAPPGVGRVAGR